MALDPSLQFAFLVIGFAFAAWGADNVLEVMVQGNQRLTNTIRAVLGAFILAAGIYILLRAAELI